MRTDELIDVSDRFARHPDIAGKQALQRRFMGSYRNAALLRMISQEGMPSVTPGGLTLQQRSAQTWSEAQAEWLKSHPNK